MKKSKTEPIEHPDAFLSNLEKLCEESDYHADVLDKVYCSLSFYSKVDCKYQDNFVDEHRAYACLNPKYNPKVCPWKAMSFDKNSTTFKEVKPGHPLYGCVVCLGINNKCRSYEVMQNGLKKRNSDNATE